MSMQTPLAKVKYLGSAKSGTDHFIKQRITAFFMLPLLIWFVVTIISFVSVSPYELPYLLTSPLTIIGAILFIINYLYHASLGLQMIIEDYIHHKGLQMITMILMKAICYVSMVAGIVGVSTIYFLSRIT